MNRYLRSIGYHNITNLLQLESILQDVIDTPAYRSIQSTNDGYYLAQFQKDLGNGYGISIIGEYASEKHPNEHFVIEHYYPYYYGSGQTEEESMFVEENQDKLAYTGVSNNSNLGIPLIYHIQNIMDYKLYSHYCPYEPILSEVAYSGLSVDGVIILGFEEKKSSEQRKQKSREEKRGRLISAARNGDMDAVESLTLADIDLYSSVSKRSKEEDLYSIVDSYIIPYGSNSEEYSVMGTITRYNAERNPYTNASLHTMTVQANGIELDILINAVDLIGEPAVGRRFKGIVWLQGYLILPDDYPHRETPDESQQKQE